MDTASHRINNVQGKAMDDETFKKELLTRLDKIVTLLSISCNLSKALLDKSQAATTAQPAAAAPSEESSDNAQYLIKDEMQENYNQAVQEWKSGRGL